MALLPAGMNDVSVDWLNEVLGAHPDFRGRRITHFSGKPVGEGIGQMSAIARLTLAYAGEAGPESIVVKLHAPFEAMRAVGIRYDMYLRETEFFRGLAADVSVPLPLVYFAGWDPDRQCNALVMQDMSSWFWPDQLEGHTLRQAEACVDAIAKLGAGHWGADFSDHPWLPDAHAPVFQRIVGDYGVCVPPALERLASFVTPEMRAACERIARNIAWIVEKLTEPPLILTHFDPRMENFVFSDVDAGALALIDWQLMAKLHPGWDIAYFLGTSLPVELRRQWQKPLLDRYLAGLKAGGVRDYDSARLFDDMRLGTMAMTIIPVIGGASFDVGNPRSVALFGAILSRALASVVENDCVALLPA